MLPQQRRVGGVSPRFANIELADDITRTDAAWIIQGMQTLLKEGNRVSLGVFACGAAGGVLLVDSIGTQAR